MLILLLSMLLVINRFDGVYANHIILSYCHSPVDCRSLVDRYGSPGSFKPNI